MKRFEIRYSDGSTLVVKSPEESMARSFAMEKKYGSVSQNKTWPCYEWKGEGLSVRELVDDA